MDIDNPGVVLLNCKKAEDGNGYILRLWNMEQEAMTTRISLPFANIKKVVWNNMVEEDLGEETFSHEKGISLIICKMGIATIRVLI
jgi:alpha-mannosidase